MGKRGRYWGKGCGYLIVSLCDKKQWSLQNQLQCSVWKSRSILVWFLCQALRHACKSENSMFFTHFVVNFSFQRCCIESCHHLSRQRITTPENPYCLQWDAPHLPPKMSIFLRRSSPYLKHSSLNWPIHHPKQHPDPISHFSTFHWADFIVTWLILITRKLCYPKDDHLIYECPESFWMCIENLKCVALANNSDWIFGSGLWTLI